MRNVHTFPCQRKTRQTYIFFHVKEKRVKRTYFFTSKKNTSNVHTFFTSKRKTRQTCILFFTSTNKRWTCKVHKHSSNVHTFFTWCSFWNLFSFEHLIWLHLSYLAMDDDCAKHMFQIHYGAWLAVYRQMFVTCKALKNPALQMVQDNVREIVEASWQGYMNSDCTCPDQASTFKLGASWASSHDIANLGDLED